MAEWQRLTHNLYVVSQQLSKARDAVIRLEGEQRGILQQLETCERETRGALSASEVQK